MAQPAYAGYVAAEDGALDKFRTNPVFRKKDGGLRHGLRSELFGDLHKTRNELLQHRGVAQARNTGKCLVRRRFKPGDRRHVSLGHSLDHLHRLGLDMRGLCSTNGKMFVNWSLKVRGPNFDAPCRVILERAMIAAIPEGKGLRCGLFLSTVFAEGLAWVVLVQQATKHGKLLDAREALRNAPLDEHGAPILLKAGSIDMSRTYRTARDALRAGELPSSPRAPIRFKR